MDRRLLPIAVLLVVLLPATSALAKKKKKSEEPPPPPPTGWVDVGNGISCYNPPEYSKLAEIDRRQARQATHEAVKGVLRGERGMEMDFGEEFLDEFDVAFLGRPEKIEAFSRTNWENCNQVARGQMSLSDYKYFLSKAPKDAMKGECTNPLMYELHDYLGIQNDWQVRRHVCKADQVLIESTQKSKYTVNDTGKDAKWINLAGDPDVPQAGEGFPCPECPLGALLIRFEDEETGEVQVRAMGGSYEFKAPANGYISFAINDTTYFDNRFYEANGLKDYLSIDIYPPVREGAGK